MTTSTTLASVGDENQDFTYVWISDTTHGHHAKRRQRRQMLPLPQLQVSLTTEVQSLKSQTSMPAQPWVPRDCVISNPRTTLLFKY